MAQSMQIKQKMAETKTISLILRYIVSLVRSSLLFNIDEVFGVCRIRIRMKKRKMDSRCASAWNSTLCTANLFLARECSQLQIRLSMRFFLLLHYLLR